MTQDEVQRLRSGLYRIHWHSGGTSLASVGVTRDGGRWLAPVNWVAPATTPEWEAVARAEPVPLEREPGDAARAEVEVARLEREQEGYAGHVRDALALEMRPMLWAEWVAIVRKVRR